MAYRRATSKRTVIHIAPVIWVIMAAAASAQAGPLSNPGFEDTLDSMPSMWKVFVAPQPGATGELDSDHAFEGQHSVRLHIPTAYAVEPVNNWSQPLPIDEAGKHVRVRAYIKTHDATEAAIWLQCFKRDPWMVLKQVSSSIDTPVYGTMDWTPVVFETLIPRGTDYAMIRCVLKGHGTAWFDNVTVEPVRGSETRKNEPLKTAAHEMPIEVTPPEPESISPIEPTPISTQPPAPKPELPQPSTNETLRESNEALANQLKQLQAEIAELRAVFTHPAPVADRPPPPPPLVPHGYQWENAPK